MICCCWPKPPSAPHQDKGGSGVNVPSGVPPDLVHIIENLKNDPRRMQGLEQNNPKLARAIRSNDYAALMNHVSKVNQREAELQREYARLEADPFDVEAQKRIEEIIREKNVEDNFAQVGT